MVARTPVFIGRLIDCLVDGVGDASWVDPSLGRFSDALNGLIRVVVARRSPLRDEEFIWSSAVSTSNV